MQSDNAKFYASKMIKVTSDFILKVMKKQTSSSTDPITAIWVTHRLEELYFCDGAAILKNGAISNWNSGSKVFQEIKSLALRQLARVNS